MPFLQKDEAPATVNPSLWRQAQLNAVNGLFMVGRPRLPGAAALDISNMTIIEGDSGLILIDPLLSNENCKGPRLICISPTGRAKTRRGRWDLHPQPRRPFWRRQGRDVR